MHTPPQRWLITGASSGIGRALAVQLGCRACRVAITGRRDEQLAETAALVRDAGGDALKLVGSVTDRDVVREHAQQILSAFGGLDVAVLNAGVGINQEARLFAADDYERCFDVNLFGVCRWIECVLPWMIEARRGVIVGVSSPAGWRGLPGVGPYSASKAALSTMLESLRIDLRDFGIDVITACPGFVQTEMTAGNDPRAMPGLMDANTAARLTLRGINRRRRVVHYPRRLTWPLRWGLRLMPDAVYDRLARWMIS